MAENRAAVPSLALIGYKKVLITGISGFVGQHLTDYLLANFSDCLVIHGISNATGSPESSKLATHPNLTFHRLNLEDTAGLTDLLEEIRPDYIFHLAARSFVGLAITDPGLTLNTNINITLSLFEAARVAGLAGQTRILNIGSSDQYGFLQPQDVPVGETTAFRPGNPYAVSKIAQEMLGYQYFRSYNLEIINTRTFNHVGPGQSAELAIGAFARQIAQAEAGLSEPIVRVGNLAARRDFTDVRDIVRAYWLAISPEQVVGYSGCLPGEVYNICSGQDYSIGEMLERLIGLAHCPFQVQTDPARMRPSDIPILRGDYSKFHHATGWQPCIPIEQSLTDLLNYWRETVQQTIS